MGVHIEEKRLLKLIRDKVAEYEKPLSHDLILSLGFIEFNMPGVDNAYGLNRGNETGNLRNSIILIDSSNKPINKQGDCPYLLLFGVGVAVVKSYYQLVTFLEHISVCTIKFTNLTRIETLK